MKSTDDVELSSPLRSFIRNNYGSAEKYAEECGTINRLRQDMRGAGRDSMGRDLLYRYYGQLELLELRFPIDEEHILISFNWYDAFTEVPISQYSLAYEKACVLFNIAAILSYTASSQTRSEVDGMKKAFHSLQACSGLLNFINENFLHAPSSDLSREAVKALSTIMLAQAQEVFTEKQIRDNGKSSIIAKLASETASLYHNANEVLTELVIAGTIDTTWGPFCQTKEKYFAGLTNFYQASFEEEKGKYGSAVSRFTLAQTLFKEALALSKSHSGQFSRCASLSNDPGPAFVELLKATVELATEKLTTAKRENDMIYHEAVLKESSLTPVAKLASAKAISLQDFYAGQDVARIIGHDIFHKLIPLAVHESASLYSEEIDRLLRAEQERSEIADTELSTALEYLGLPKALHHLKVSDQRMAQDLSGVSDRLTSLAQTIALQERADPIASHLTYIRNCRTRTEESLRRSSQRLDEESRQCESMRTKFSGQWTQTSSQNLTTGMRQDLQNYRQSLESAGISDAKMESEYQGVATEIGILGRDVDGLETAFQDLVIQSSGSHNTAGSNLLDLPEEDDAGDILDKVDQVDDILRKLQLVRKERSQTLQDLKEKARKDDISDVLILNKKTPGIEQRVFATELEKFNPHRNRISATISRQEQLVEEMTVTFTSVLENKQSQSKQQRWSKVARQRSDLTTRLEKAAEVYQGLVTGARRSKAFHEELSKLADAVASNVNAFIQRRQDEGRAMLAGVSGRKPANGADPLRGQLERMSFKNDAAQRPQPPPPNSYQRPY